MIARIVHEHTPENQLNYSLFAKYEISNKKIEKLKKENMYMLDINSIPQYYVK